MRYFDKDKKTEVPSVMVKFRPDGAIDSENIVSLPDDNVFFSPIPEGKEIEYKNNLPYQLVDITYSEEEEKARKIKEIKVKRDKDMSYVTVSHNSKSWSFSPIDMSRFESKIARDRNFLWKADDGKSVELTSTQGENIAKEVDDALTKIFFDAELAIDALG